MTTIQAVNSYYDESLGVTITIVFTDMDTGIDEQVVYNGTDDTYTILLNSRCSDEALLTAYEHARDHIRNRDFDKEQVQRIEAVAHGLADLQQDPSASVPAETDEERRQREHREMLCSQIIEHIRKERKKIQRKLNGIERRRKKYEAIAKRHNLLVEERIIDDEYGRPVCLTALVTWDGTVVQYLK